MKKSIKYFPKEQPENEPLNVNDLEFETWKKAGTWCFETLKSGNWYVVHNTDHEEANKEVVITENKITVESMLDKRTSQIGVVISQHESCTQATYYASHYLNG